MPLARTWDANEAVAHVAYRVSELVALYPITPASPMGEHADTWATAELPNLWGDVPRVVELQSEGGAAGTVHGALQAGALATTFTASQGLLLMLPNLYKIAGELTPAVIHVAARSIATHALSIFGDHSDVYAARQTGWAMLCAASVQEAHDFALVAHAATLRARVPFLHFFDGFRTSHEVAKTEVLADDDLRALLDAEAAHAHRDRALSPDHPVVRGTAQNPDVFFQAREACNPFHDAVPAVVEQLFDALAARVGRRYRLFEYHGHPEAERVVVLMGSGAGAAHETVDWLVARGERVGLLTVHLYRPFSAEHLVAALPRTTKVVGVLDRAKEPGAPGEPLYLDVLAGLHQRWDGPLPKVVGGRYGLSSKEFDPAMVKAVFDALASERPPHGFTVGIHDDVTHRSLPWDRDFDLEPDDVVRQVFYGLGADGTVGANKNSIKIIGEQTEFFAQGYFVYDSKKSGATTISHLRFGPRPIRSTYLVKRAQFVACHQPQFVETLDVLELAAPGATFLLNTPHGPGAVWDTLPADVQRTMIDRRLRFFVIDAVAVAREVGLGRRINTVMQTCAFAISGVLPRDQAVAQIKRSIEKTWSARGAQVLEANFAAVDGTLARLHEVPVPAVVGATRVRPPAVPAAAPPFVQRVTAAMLARRGDDLPVSAFVPDGTWPVGTSQWEKRAIAEQIPSWDPALCIQCNKCALVCPHAAIRVKAYPEAADAPAEFQAVPWRQRDHAGWQYTVQVAPEDCTGCTLCAAVCPARDKGNPRHKALDMVDLGPRREPERQNFAYFLGLPELDRTAVGRSVKDSQLLQPLFEFSGACAGCGETPYLKLLTQLFGDRLVIANATGCSSIYGGNLPTTPYTTDRDGRGPAWANSLFEDNAEFGYGIRLGIDQLADRARRVLRGCADLVGADLVDAILGQTARDEAAIRDQRARVAAVRERLRGATRPDAVELTIVADALVHKTVWLVGGDGWAYDIGFGGLDHVLASGQDVNVLVLDTQVYSNTGGQASKATPLGAVAKFASAGKDVRRKDLGRLAMAYGNVYVAQIAFGAKDAHTVEALAAAEAWRGPSLVIAYSHCIAHGYELSAGLAQQKAAVDSGFWPLYTFDPGREKPFALISAPPTVPFETFAYAEGRFRMLKGQDPERARALLARGQADADDRYSQLAALRDPEER
ncbi:MAG: pyruvate:ferredoxin (flavodoxin) oxidoreductase [Myxococcota bacterium]